MTPPAYVHGYHDAESRRLRDQAGALAELFHSDTTYPPGSRVLEAGCGVGAQTVILASRSPGARFTAVDVSAESLAEAGRRVSEAELDNVELVEADIFELPFGEGTFDHVFTCFVLEHLARPREALASLQRALRPGGTLTVIEGDHGSAYFHPRSDAAQAAIGCLAELQRRAGGDALIGRRLYPLLVESGFERVRVTPRMVYVDGSRAELAEAFSINTFTAMVAAVREEALAAGLIDAEAFDAGIAALERTTEPDGTFIYTFFKGIGARPAPAG